MRSFDLEILDTGEHTQEEYEDCLAKLGRLGSLLGGDRATRWSLAQLPSPPNSILDVGCGGGSFLKSLTERYPTTQCHGIDLNPNAVAYAQRKHKAEHLRFSSTPLEDIPTNSYEIVMSTLVCHHLQDEELVNFLHHCKRVAGKQVILNDLHRHPLASLSYFLIAPWLFRNRLITHDGLLSIKRAFTRSDWLRILRKSKIGKYQLTWHLPFRWIVRF